METPEFPKAKENQADLSAGKQDRNARLAYVLKNVGMTGLQSSPGDQHAMSHDEVYENITASAEKARSHRGRSLVYDEIDTALVESNVETEGPASNQAGDDFKNVMDTENPGYGTRQEPLYAEMEYQSSPGDQHAMSHDEKYENITAGAEKAQSDRGRSLVYDEIDTALVKSNVETEGTASNQAGGDFKNAMDTENPAYGTRQELLYAEMDDRSLDNYQVFDESLTFREVMKDEVLYWTKEKVSKARSD